MSTVDSQADRYVKEKSTHVVGVAALRRLRTLNGPVAREKILKQKSKPWVQGSREFGADLRIEYDKWSKLINELNLKTD